MAAQSKYYNTGGGELKFTPIENGVLGTKVDFGQTENMDFSTSVETIKHDSTEGSVAFEDLNILKKVTGKLSIATVEISPEMLGRGTLSDVTTIDTPKATATKLDDYVVNGLDTKHLLGTKFMSNVDVENSDDSTTYVEGTDYTMSYDEGAITILSSGGIADGDKIDITFDNAHYADYNLEGYTKSKIEGVLEFVSHAANGLSYTYTFHKVSLLASGSFSLKSDKDLAKISFDGVLLSSEFVTGDGVSKLFNIKSTEKFSQ